MKRACIICEKEFESYHARKACLKPTCQASFKAMQRAREKAYGVKARAMRRKPPQEIHCRLCGEPFTPSHYKVNVCGDSVCQAIYTEEKRQAKVVVSARYRQSILDKLYECPRCGERKVKRKGQHCETCIKTLSFIYANPTGIYNQNINDFVQQMIQALSVYTPEMIYD